MLTEFRERLAPFAYAAQHPGSNSYFTPPPLPMSIAGETLSRWLNQGIDLWLAGMAGPFVEEEVVRWLCDLCGFDAGAWGVLTSGGVMANIMALTVARDVHLAKLRGSLPARRRARRRPRLRLRPDAFLGRASHRSARLPGGHAPDRPFRRRLPIAGSTRCRRDRGRSRCRPACRWRSARSPARPTRARSTTSRRSRTSPNVKTSGCTSMPRTAPPPDCPRAKPTSSRPGTSRLAHRRSAQVAVPAVRHRRAAREAARGSPAHVPSRARVLRGLGPGGAAAALVPVLARGHAPVPRSQALALLEAPRVRRVRAPDRTQRRPRAPSGLARERRSASR